MLSIRRSCANHLAADWESLRLCGINGTLVCVGQPTTNAAPNQQQGGTQHIVNKHILRNLSTKNNVYSYCRQAFMSHIACVLVSTQIKNIQGTFWKMSIICLLRRPDLQRRGWGYWCFRINFKGFAKTGVLVCGLKKTEYRMVMNFEIKP